MSGIVRCSLSGSFRKDIRGLKLEYLELVSFGCQVLSPYGVDFVEDSNNFKRSKGEESFSNKWLEDHHLYAISRSDFVWLHSPDGYIGLSGALEIGYATSVGVPVYTRNNPSEEILRDYVSVVDSIFDVIAIFKYKINETS